MTPAPVAASAEIAAAMTWIAEAGSATGARAALSVVEEYDRRLSCPLTVRDAPPAMAELPQAWSQRPVSRLARDPPTIAPTCGPMIVRAWSARDWL